MRYVGGKSKLGKRIAAEIQARRGDRLYWEPFCGSLAVARHVQGPGVVSDLNAPLIALYQAIARGWDPPASISEAEYRAAKALPDSDPFKAYAGFGQSFGAKWFGGYARGEGRNFAGECRRGLLRDVPQVIANGLAIEQGSFFECAPRAGWILYLDPPYVGTLGYAAVAAFDSAAFYARAEAWARAGSIVLISEYSCPVGREIWAVEQKTTVAIGAGKKAVEKLFEVAA
jgi:DNA adenine methylase